MSEKAKKKSDAIERKKRKRVEDVDTPAPAVKKAKQTVEETTSNGSSSSTTAPQDGTGITWRIMLTSQPKFSLMMHLCMLKNSSRDKSNAAAKKEESGDCYLCVDPSQHRLIVNTGDDQIRVACATIPCECYAVRKSADEDHCEYLLGEDQAERLRFAICGVPFQKLIDSFSATSTVIIDYNEAESAVWVYAVDTSLIVDQLLPRLKEKKTASLLMPSLPMSMIQLRMSTFYIEHEWVANMTPEKMLKTTISQPTKGCFLNVGDYVQQFKHVEIVSPDKITLGLSGPYLYLKSYQDAFQLNSIQCHTLVQLEGNDDNNNNAMLATDSSLKNMHRSPHKITLYHRHIKNIIEKLNDKRFNKESASGKKRIRIRVPKDNAGPLFMECCCTPDDEVEEENDVIVTPHTTESRYAFSVRWVISGLLDE
jgi:hypothetical protein